VLGAIDAVPRASYNERRWAKSILREVLRAKFGRSGGMLGEFNDDKSRSRLKQHKQVLELLDRAIEEA
jgi:hypothetical protein